MPAPGPSFNLEAFTLGPVACQGYLLWTPSTRRAAVIDPGGDPAPILARLRAENRVLDSILNTHGHGDHILGNAELARATGAPVAVHPADAPMLTDPARNLSAAFGWPVTSPPPARSLAEGEPVRFGGAVLEVLETPGHSPGSVCLFGAGSLFSGDLLFAGSVGRTDLPGGDAHTLRRSLARLDRFDGGTRVHPGHGPETTLAEERAENPFLRNGAWV